MDKEVIVLGVTIENPTAMVNVAEIIAVPELESSSPDRSTSRCRSATPASRPTTRSRKHIDANEKAKVEYRILNLGSTTGALQGVMRSWLDDYKGA